MKKSETHVSIRMDTETWRKFQYVAKYDDRSASGHFMSLIRNCIREFEKEHGEITLEDTNTGDG